MPSNTFDLKICEEALKSTIQAHEEHHHNILESLLRFQEGKHEEIVSINGVSALISTLSPPEFLKCDIFNSPYYLLIQSYQKKLSQGSETWTSTPNKNSRRYTSDSDVQTDSDISGVPLESAFAVNESEAVYSPLILQDSIFHGREAISFNGFPLKKAQQISAEIRKVCRRSNKAADIKTPIFIMCDGRDSQKTVFLGVGPGALVRAVCSPVFEGTEHLPTISHLTYNFIFGCYSKEVDTSAQVRYEILKRSNDLTSSVTIHCSWKRPSGMLGVPTIDLLSDVELFVHPSDPDNAAHTLQQELSLMESLIDGVEAGEVMWNVKERQHTVADQLNKLFDDVNERKIDKPDQTLLELDNLIEQRFAQVRQNLDFTDQVWNVLKESESYTELQTGFGSIFEAIKTDLVRPFVHELDVTKLAKSCKQLMRGGTTVNINELEPLKMLLEIGLDKIKRDYMSVFLASELVTNDELDSLISWSSVKDEPKKCLKALKKLCLTMQCIVLLRKYINLPQTVLSHCTTNIFKRLVSIDDLPRSFNFSIQNILLQEQFSSVSLAEWVFKISSSGESDRPKQMTYRVTKMPLFRNVSDEEFVIKDANARTKYYGFCLSVFPDSFIP